ncbi:hypothetical protein [Gordonia polyisoprenivorans]|uniref:hypothetical protein n=1 Tax=Gordonia polyisoprenivorans TaxID=84595 RepID=UPI001FCB8162|nr:hypothetical protein [Gordonia polyisoprenivorans]
MTGEWTSPEDVRPPDPSAPDLSTLDPGPASGPTTDRLPVPDGLPRPPITERRPSVPNWNRITAWEVVGYTVAIVFLAAVALGVFDIMLPWTAS